ncbi:MAG: hypothetical protein COB51_09355, partial [Moraxellaceae bacterium]
LIFTRLLLRSRHAPAYRRRLAQRLGYVTNAPKPGGIWIHAVSVGETLAAVPLVKRLQRDYPDLPIAITTMTPTGSEQVRKNFSIKLLTQVGKRLTFDVQPLAAQSAYKKLELVVENERVVAMSFTDHLGQISSIRFTQIVVGKPIASSEFTIVPAPGVDVIDYYEDAALPSDSEFDSERTAPKVSS